MTTLGTLLLELLDVRLLSVLTWYHLSFLAVSLAMLGGAAGAVAVFLGGAKLTELAARRAAGALAALLAVAIPVTMFGLLRARIPAIEHGSAAEIAPLALAIVLLTIPFFLSGVVVTIALTRCGGPIGRLYAADLVGAAIGCLLVVPVLDRVDMLSAGLLTGAVVAGGAYCFLRAADAMASSAPAAPTRRGGTLPLALAGALVAAAAVHVGAGAPVGVANPRGRPLAPASIELALWNAYSHVTVERADERRPFYWGRGEGPEPPVRTSALMRIDGAAATPLMRWDGRRESLDWVQYDVTALPHHLRAGHAAVIGVGGGRDILSAIWGGSDRITAVELNEIFVDLLHDRYEAFTRIVGYPGVRIVNDEGRSYMSRTDERFDVLQMSLVDTWAATGAGAFTLTENALYTVEAWKLFLSRLAPGGLFSTSRWFSPKDVSETSRLLSLCVAALLELGVEEPARHVALVARGRVATLLASVDPLSPEDVARIRDVSRQMRFSILALPGRPPADARLAAILASRSSAELEQATADRVFDYGAPRDRRPYFFNMLKPSAQLLAGLPGDNGSLRSQGVVRGNLVATVTLVALLAIALGLAAVILFVPLAFVGLPAMDRRGFGLALAYFALIGYGFMSIQIPLLQSFSVLLGHPIYTYSIILFGMIFAAGLGSLASERVDPFGRWRVAIPLAIAVALLVLRAALPPLVGASVGLPLAARAAIVLACTVPIALLLGFCFPLGMRLVGALAPTATPWMWAVNGVCGVLASVLAVAVSMWAGIGTNLAVAAALYLLLVVPAGGLARRAAPLVAARGAPNAAP